MMGKKKRPNLVPEEAIWIEAEKEWQIGTIANGKDAPRGQCKAWREDGSLAAEYNLDVEGVVQGLVTRYHPDGTVASSGEWKDGGRFGQFMFQQSENQTPEPYEADLRTWRYEFYSENNWDEKNRRWFAKDGTPTTSDGRPLKTAFDMDQVVDTASPIEFLRMHGESCFKKFYGHDFQSTGIEESLSEFWGIPVAEIARVSNLIVKFSSQTCRAFPNNCWETVISEPWFNLHEELSAFFMGAIQIGSIGDSDQVYCTLFNPIRQKSRPNAVYVWNHDYYHLEEVIALSVDDFAFASVIHHAHKAERLSDQGAGKAWSKLKNRVYLHHGLRSGVDFTFDQKESNHEQIRSCFQTDLDSSNYVRQYYWRAQWLTRLLVVDSDRDFNEIKQSFLPGFNPPFNSSSFIDIRNFGSLSPPTAVYLLWRLFWTDDQRLDDCLKFYSNHAARIVRDLADLLMRFNSGLKGIPGLKDVNSTRQEFLKLKLFG